MPPELDRPFDSALGVLGRSARIFGRGLPRFAALTLAVFVPGKLLTQLGCAMLDMAPDGLGSYLLMDLATLVLSSCTVPAIVHAVLRDAGSASRSRSADGPGAACCGTSSRRR